MPSSSLASRPSCIVLGSFSSSCFLGSAHRLGAVGAGWIHSLVPPFVIGDTWSVPMRSFKPAVLYFVLVLGTGFVLGMIRVRGIGYVGTCRAAPRYRASRSFARIVHRQSRSRVWIGLPRHTPAICTYAFHPWAPVRRSHPPALSRPMATSSGTATSG